MGSDRVVLVEPLVDDDPGFSQRGKQPSIQTGDAKDGIETFVIGILPRTAWIELVGIDLFVFQPFLDDGRHQFGPVVAADTDRPTVFPK